MNALRLAPATIALTILAGCATTPAPTPSDLAALAGTVHCPVRTAMNGHDASGDGGIEPWTAPVLRNGDDVAKAVLQGHSTTLIEAGAHYRVDLLVLVGSNGAVKGLQVQLPSGNGLVDRSAERAGWDLEFTPATMGGMPAESCVTLPLLLGNQVRHASGR